MMKPWVKPVIITALLAALVAGLAVVAARGAVWEWSKTAATNATADPTINWSEGMAPSAVNDSARAMMARLAEYRDDVSGVLATGGTSTAYTVATNQGLDSPPVNGQLLAFTPHATNGLSPTLAADGGTAFPIQTAPSVAVAADTLVLGTPYTVKFNTSASAWILRGVFANPFNVPLGTILDYVGTTAPNSNFVLSYGQCISRTTYASFFSLVSTLYGVCDGTTTFGVPDFRGTISAGKDNMGGSTRGLITNAGASCVGTTLGVQCGAQNVTLGTGNLPPYTPAGTNSTSAVTISGQGGGVVKTPGATLTGIGVGAGNFELVVLTGTAAAQGFTGQAQGGTSDPVNKLPPLQVVNKIIRIF